jgi:hypothetical protein
MMNDCHMPMSAPIITNQQKQKVTPSVSHICLYKFSWSHIFKKKRKKKGGNQFNNIFYLA